MLNIDDKTFSINENNYIKTKTEKKQIVISFSLRKKNYHILRLQQNEMGKSKMWNTFTIDRNGNVFQHYNDEYYTNYLIDGKNNKEIISIVLENMGGLVESPNGEFINQLNEVCDFDSVIEKKWLSCSYWEKIPETQFNNLILLCQFLLKKHNIPSNVIEFQHYHKNIYKYIGIVFMSNYIDDFTYFNPMFDINEFKRKIQ
ncbi:MAG TPA: N-acetylmuramoyl-L-alanine amidase [archaeon]|jgi:hypothetical protein|nr:N-acetylmuramoyl-L-alanine amidase [archaeon]